MKHVKDLSKQPLSSISTAVCLGYLLTRQLQNPPGAVKGGPNPGQQLHDLGQRSLQLPRAAASLHTCSCLVRRTQTVE